MQGLDLQTETIDVDGHKAAVIVLSGYLDTYTAPSLLKALQAAADEGAVDIVFDMAALEYMSSAGFGVIAGAHHRVGDKGGKLVVACLSDKLQSILDDLGLSEIVPTAATREAAISLLK